MVNAGLRSYITIINFLFLSIWKKVSYLPQNRHYSWQPWNFHLHKLNIFIKIKYSFKNQRIKLNNHWTGGTIFLNFILYPTQEYWSLVRNSGPGIITDQWTDKGPLISVAQSYQRLSIILQPTWSSEECPQKGFWKFRHSSGLLSKSYLLGSDLKFMILNFNLKSLNMKPW